MKPRDNIRFKDLTQEEQSILLWAWRLNLPIEFRHNGKAWYRTGLKPSAFPYLCFRLAPSIP